MFRLLAGNYDDVLDVVMTTVEEAANSSEDMRKKQQIDKDISSIESKKSRMTDMLIDGTISKETYNEKNIDYSRKHNALSEKKCFYLKTAYCEWLGTQGDSRGVEDELHPKMWIFSDSRMHALRAPGNTCLSALKSLAGAQVIKVAENNSKGCGRGRVELVCLLSRVK